MRLHLANEVIVFLISAEGRLLPATRLRVKERGLGWLLSTVFLAGVVLGPGAAAQETAVPAQISAPSIPAQHKPSSSQPAQPEKVIGPLLPAGEDPQNKLLSPFVKHLAQDQQTFWTFPSRIRIRDLHWVLPSAAFTASVIASDSWISRQVPQSASRIRQSKEISNYAVFSLLGATGGAYFLGAATHNDHLREAGFLGGEAAIDSTAAAYVLKVITQRPRPYQGNGHGSFFQGGTSFPSEHAALAWSTATVLAHEYPNKAIEILAYGLAAAVTVSRITAKQHFASDALVGSALGWYFGREVYRAHHNPKLGGVSESSLPPPDDAEQTTSSASADSPSGPPDKRPDDQPSRGAEP